MNENEIIELARQVGGYDGFTSPPTNWWPGDFLISREQLLDFAALIRNAVLDEAAEICEKLDEETNQKENRLATGQECAKFIRAMISQIKR